MIREPGLSRSQFLSEGLHAGKFDLLPLSFPAIRFAGYLPPPASGAGVFQHGIEMIHFHQPELFGLTAIDEGVHPSGPANGARVTRIRLPQWVLDVVVVADQLNRVSLDSCQGHTDNQPVGVNFVFPQRRPYQLCG